MKMREDQKEALKILFSSDNKVLEGNKTYGKIFYELLCETESKNYKAEIKGALSSWRRMILKLIVGGYQI